MKPQVYDSGDPNLPNLPDTDQIQWSDYDDYLSNRPSSESSSSSTLSDESDFDEGRSHSTKRKKRRKNSTNSKKSVNTNSKNPRISINDIDQDRDNQSIKSNRKKSAATSTATTATMKPTVNRGRSKTVGSQVITFDNSQSNTDDEKENESNSLHRQRQRSNSILSRLHLPRLSRHSSPSVKLTKTTSKTTSSSSPISTPIIQPTRSHSIAAGALLNDRASRIQSDTPPYDEELGLSVGPEAYADRDVTYYNNNNEHLDIIEHSNSSALGSPVNANEREYDEADLSDVEDNMDDEINNNREQQQQQQQVEIDQRRRKIMRTDTDDESSSFKIPKTGYQPESILMKHYTHESDTDGHAIIDSENDDENGDHDGDGYRDNDGYDSGISPTEKNDELENDLDANISDDENDEGNRDDEEDENANEQEGVKLKKSRRRRQARRRRRKKSRKYAGSQSKKERTAWEPGIDLRTTDVFLNSPGSIITITDYSKTRYRVSHYDLYSENNSRYAKFMTDDTILSAHDFGDDYDEDDEDDESNSEFHDFIAYMNKVSDSYREVEDAIQSKPIWSQVRWININGLSWEAISIIGKKYNLHPLSVEDLVDIPQRTKMDIYQQHLFIVMPLMKLLKVKKINDESNETHFERIRKNIREMFTSDNVSNINKSKSRKSSAATTTSTSNKRNASSSYGTSKSSSTMMADGGNATSNVSSAGPLEPPKVVTKTIATREQLSREFSAKSVVPNNSSIQIQQQSGNGQMNINNTRSNRNRTGSGTSSRYNNGRNKNYDEDGHYRGSAFNDLILPRSNKTFRKKIVYSSEEEYRLAIEIERASRDRRLTDLTFITPSSNKYKTRMATINRMRPLMSKSLAVGVEQVSLYLTNDGTVLSFFEHSAMDIERAILSRLSAEYTILRESCNSSILFHSVLDANVDLLYPVITAYSRILNEKELEILTASLPDLQHTQELHLMLNELAILKNSILPISSLITQLKDLSMDSNSIFIDESCKLYLADIGDHILAFIDEIDSMSSTIENLIDLIFNTLSVETNNSMQQLSLVSVLFLPLTFWAGYFGMNFKSFGNIDLNVSFFWKVAIPFTAGMMMLVMKNSCWRVLRRFRRFLRSIWNAILEFQNRRRLLENGDENEYGGNMENMRRMNRERWNRFRNKTRKRE